MYFVEVVGKMGNERDDGENNKEQRDKKQNDCQGVGRVSRYYWALALVYQAFQNPHKLAPTTMKPF